MADLPENVVDRVEQLTRLARETPDSNEAAAYRSEREELLGEYGYSARVRDADEDEAGRAVLVCYPDEWMEEGTARLERIEDTDRAVERPLEGPTDADWEAVAAWNDAIVDAVAEAHGAPHAETARALADYANNHHATTIDRLTETDVERFREDYFPRNAWPTDEQFAVLDKSIRIVREKAETASDVPPE
jgi:hypothetical protein